MSIRAKLLISISALVAVAFLVTGFVTVKATQSSMIDRVDDTLHVARGKPAKNIGSSQGSSGGGGSGNSTYENPYKREIAVLEFNADGSIRRYEPSGFVDEPDPAPLLPGMSRSEVSDLSDEIFTVGSVGDSDLRYRVLVTELDRGRTQVIAAPLDDVDATTRQLIVIISVTGLVVVALLVFVAWIVIRRGLKPVDDMAGTATLIAEGDLSQRVDYDDPNTEVGQLGLAFNSMLTQIEAAFSDKEASEQRLRQFVANASHELRTPITSIRGYAELYRSGAASTPEQIDRAMGRIESEGARMGRLVEDLLLLARLDQGRPIQHEPVDLVSLVGDAVTDARVAEPERPISYEHPQQAIVNGDQDKLQQVIANLLANARTHTDATTPVHVAVQTTAKEVTVTVADEGPGIEADDVGRVFDRFYRAATPAS